MVFLVLRGMALEGGRTVVRLSRGMAPVHTTIWLHQVTGVPRGTFRGGRLCPVPLLPVDRYRDQGFGVAVGSMWRARGGPDIIGKVWCSQDVECAGRIRLE